MSDLSMHGRVCLITGATSGIGQATALELARMGAEIVLVCRSRERGFETLSRIEKVAPGRPVELLRADLSSQEEVRKLARDFLALERPLHVLVNNAGVVQTRYTETVDGIETTLAVNHLAPFLLTQLLLERLRSSAPARIVNVGSAAYRRGRMRFDDLGHRRGYRMMRVYAQSKLANLLFTQELAARLAASGVTVNCAHPGAVRTGLGMNNGRVLPWLVRRLVHPLLKSPEQGAETVSWLAASPDLEGHSGSYFVDRHRIETPRVWGDPYVARRLWDVSEELVGLTP
jgi:NAD(P)-dependent dehydrogenase (short-subunit alcohol dehydrogenase family)